MYKRNKNLYITMIIVFIGLMIFIITSIFGISVADANATPQIVTQEQIRQFVVVDHIVNADESKISNVPESTLTTPNDSATAISPSAK